MSRSPDEQAKSAQRDAYQRAWAALQRLLRQGKSFSGREKNCCFLNAGASGDGRFATVSAATGLDFPDDSRGLALCDWDHDGREDLWITNRSGPRVRLLLNRYPSGDNHWLTLRLSGDGKTVNRDAVGARVEIHLPGKSVPLLRTVYAGSGFLSQSSRWLHLGLGPAERINRIVVKWPGGPVESFSSAAPNGFFELHQGTGAVKAWTPPDKKPSLAAAVVPRDEEPFRNARVPLVAPLPVPLSLMPEEPGPKGTALLLWSVDCPNCAALLKSWAAAEPAWKKSGILVTACCLDATKADAAAKATQLGWRGAVSVWQDRPHTGAAWNALQKGLMGLQTDLPVPSLFLLDGARRLTAFYKGPVSAAQLQADFALLAPLDFAARLTAVAPDRGGGQWHDPISGTSVTSPAVMLLDAGMTGEARELLEAAITSWSALDSLTEPATADWRLREMAGAHRLLASPALSADDPALVEKHFLASLEIKGSPAVRRDLVKHWQARRDPSLYPKIVEQLRILLATDSDPALMAKLGVLYLEAGLTAEALPLLETSANLRPDSLVLFQLGQVYRGTGRAADAAAAWTRALLAKPDLVPALNNLAWLRATQPDAANRNGAAAITLAEKAVPLAPVKQQYIILTTLAAAHAEAGDFSAALKAAGSARVAASTAADQKWVEKLDLWIAQFRRHEKIRE